MALSVVAALLAVAASAQQEHRHGPGEVEKLGRVDFTVSCNAEAGERFGRAVALLHSFWYDEAEKAFAQVARLDPSCAMGHWGVAMSLFHPIWAAANPAAAPTPAEFARGKEAVEEAKALGGKTSRERDYIGAVEAFYAGPATSGYPARAQAFEKAMEQVHARNPRDREAAIFYALALLGNAPPEDKTYARQKKAADLLNAVLPEAPDHPGVAHYLIHSFDYPPLAPLALPAARAYSKIAASSPHALHMPSHIFTRLALWDDSIQSNLASAESARRHLAQTRPGAASFDELHALDYLAYAYLQKAQDGKAKAVLQEITKVRALDVPNFAAAYALAAVPARVALERRQWGEAASLTIGPDWFPWGKFSSSAAILHFARAIGGARSGDLAAAVGAVARLAEIGTALAAAGDGYWAEQVEIQRLAGSAWVAFSEGRREEALALMRQAADKEDASEKHPVTPGAVLPARELLAEMLLEAGRPAAALEAYETSLRNAPGRFNGLQGAARAAQRAGEGEKAHGYAAQLLALAGEGEGRRAELDEARAMTQKP